MQTKGAAIRPPLSCWLSSSRLRLQQQLAEEVGGFQGAVGVGGLSQLESLVNGGLDNAPVEAGDDLAHILPRSRIAAEYLDLPADEQPEMQLSPQSASCSADAVAAAGTQRSESVAPDIGAHGVQQQVNPALPVISRTRWEISSSL